jgi:hypothetical protein
MDKTIRRFDSFEAMKAAEYLGWQDLPPHIRMRAATELSIATYAVKNGDVPRLDRTLKRLQRA